LERDAATASARPWGRLISPCHRPILPRLPRRFTVKFGALRDPARNWIGVDGRPAFCSKSLGLQIRAAFLDHGEAVLAFALEERAHINVWRNKVEAMGLSIGPWLRAFKQATLRGALYDTLIEVAWRDRPSNTAAFLPLAVSKWRS
jgi:hypothetical protein